MEEAKRREGRPRKQRRRYGPGISDRQPFRLIFDVLELIGELFKPIAALLPIFK